MQPSPPPAPASAPASKSRYLQLLDETTADELQGDNPLDRASATLATDFKRCDRYGYLRHRCGVRAEQKKAQNVGEELHDQWKHYLREGKAPTNPLAIGALTYLPPPKASGIVVERGFQFASTVERHDGPGLIQWFGYWDLYDGRNPELHEVTDHKTTSDFRYAKAPHELAKDPQMVLYASGSWHLEEVMACPDCRGTGKKWNFDTKTREVCEACSGVGKLAPLVTLGVQRRKADAPIKVRHLYTLTKKSTKPPKEVPFTFHAGELETAWHALNQDLVSIRGIWQVPDWRQVTPTGFTNGGCEKYGGCPYRRFCDDQHALEHNGSDAAVAELHLMETLMAHNPPAPTNDQNLTEQLEKSIAHVNAQKSGSVVAELNAYRPPARASGVLPPDARPPQAVAPGQSGQLSLATPAPGHNSVVESLNARVQRPAAPPPAAPPPPPPAAAQPPPSPWAGTQLPPAAPAPRKLTVPVWGVERDVEAHALEGGRFCFTGTGEHRGIMVYGESEPEARGKLVVALCKVIPPPVPGNLPPPTPPSTPAPAKPAEPPHVRHKGFMSLALVCKEQPEPITVRDVEGIAGLRTDGIWEGILVDGTRRTASSKEGLVQVLALAPAGTNVGGEVSTSTPPVSTSTPPAAQAVTTENPVTTNPPEKAKRERKPRKPKEGAQASTEKPAETPPAVQAVTTENLSTEKAPPEATPAQVIAAVQDPEPRKMVVSEVVEVEAAGQIFDVKIWQQESGLWAVEHTQQPYTCRVPNNKTRAGALEEIAGYLSALVELADQAEEQKATETAVEEALSAPEVSDVTPPVQEATPGVTPPPPAPVHPYNPDFTQRPVTTENPPEGWTPVTETHVRAVIGDRVIEGKLVPHEETGFDLFIGCEPVKGYGNRPRVLLEDYVEGLHASIRAGKKVPDVRALNFSECRAVLAAMVHQNQPRGLVIARGHGELGALVLEILRPYATRIVM